MKESVANKIKGRLSKFVDAPKNDDKISEKFTCRTVVLDLEPESYDAERVRNTRKLLGLSQAMFARFLGVKVRTVQSWEQGDSVPKDMACRFMDEIQRDPKHWQARLKQAMRVKDPC